MPHFVLYMLLQSGDTPLHKAAQWGHRKIAEELLLRGADADCVNNVSMCIAVIVRLAPVMLVSITG